MKKKGWIALTSGVAVIGAVAATLTLKADRGTADAVLDPYDADLIGKGRQVYREQCASCHGANLEGETPAWRERKSNGRLPAPPHDVSGHTWHHPDEHLIAITRMGTAEFVGNGYESDMPGFGDVLSDREIVAVLSYIKSQWPREIIRAHDERNRQ